MKHSIKKVWNYAVLLLTGTMAFSCVSTNTLLVDIPYPSEKELPPSIQSLTLVTQAVDSRYTDLHADSLQKIFYESQFNLDTTIRDLQMADTTLMALGELLYESGRYDYVIPEERFIEPERRSFTGLQLSWDEVNRLCDTYETNAVLSLDHLKTEVHTKYDHESFFDPSRNGFYSAATADMQVSYEALFRIYDPVEEEIVLREFLRDTLYWEDMDVSTRKLFERFPPVKKGLTEAGIVIALELSDQIAVQWYSERRKYFARGNAGMRQASQFAANGNWEEAIARWEKVAESGSKSLKSKAQLNIALGYEILGNLNLAIEWALKSYNTMYRPLTYEYLRILQRRENQLKKAE